MEQINVKGFNSASVENYFLFIVDDNIKQYYYRIDLESICSLLGIEKMPSNEIEDQEEYKEYDMKNLIAQSEKYAEYEPIRKSWKYYLQQFLVPVIYFEGYNSSEFPLHMYRSGKGFTKGFGKTFQKGIESFSGIDGIEEIHVSKAEETSIRKIRNKGYKIILSESDYNFLFNEVSIKRQMFSQISQTTITEFFHKRFPDKSKYDEKSNGKDLKKIFLASMSETIIPALNKEELVKVEDFFQKVIGDNIHKKEFAQRNFLKIAECNLEIILKEFDTNLKKNPKEEVWQRFFEKNIFIFDSRYTNFLSKFSVKVGRSAQPDFLVYDIYGYVDIYEIKKSTVELLKYDASHDNYYWSSDVSKAISQLEKYIFDCTRNKEILEKTAKEEKNIDIKIVRPKGVLVIGSRENLSNDSMKKDFEIMRSSLKNIEIILYDEMYERLKNLKIDSLRTFDN